MVKNMGFLHSPMATTFQYVIALSCQQTDIFQLHIQTSQLCRVLFHCCLRLFHISCCFMLFHALKDKRGNTKRLTVTLPLGRSSSVWCISFDQQDEFRNGSQQWFLTSRNFHIHFPHQFVIAGNRLSYPSHWPLVSRYVWILYQHYVVYFKITIRVRPLLLLL